MKSLLKIEYLAIRSRKIARTYVEMNRMKCLKWFLRVTIRSKDERGLGGALSGTLQELSRNKKKKKRKREVR